MKKVNQSNCEFHITQTHEDKITNIKYKLNKESKDYNRLLFV